MKIKAISVALFAVLPTIASADTPNVVVDIAPVHSLVAKVMEGIADPQLVLDANRSPHDMALRPSDARKVQDADVVVSTGAVLDTRFGEIVSKLAPEASHIELDTAPGVELLSSRGSGLFSDAVTNTGHDPHFWLAPENAVAMVTAISDQLSIIDPDNAATYRANASDAQSGLNALSATITNQVPQQPASFLVYHDATQYFETAFGVQAAGTFFADDELPPAISTLAELKNFVSGEGVICVLAEPGFNLKLVGNVFQDTQYTTTNIDVLGMDLTPGATLYDELLTNLATAITTCVGSNS